MFDIEKTIGVRELDVILSNRHDQSAAETNSRAGGAPWIRVNRCACCIVRYTPQTVRRDVNNLCDQGLLLRQHGGASLPLMNSSYLG